LVPLLQRPLLLSWFHRWRREVTNRQFRTDYEEMADREERASTQLRLLVGKLAERQQSALQVVGQHALSYGSRSSSQNSNAAAAAALTTISTTTTHHQQQHRVLLASRDGGGMHPGYGSVTLAFASTTPCSIARDGEESSVADMDSAQATPRSHAYPLPVDPTGTSLSYQETQRSIEDVAMATSRQLVQLQEQRSLPRSSSRSGGSSPLHGADVNVVMAQQPLLFHAAGAGSPGGAASPAAAGASPASDGRKAAAALQASSAAMDDIDQLVRRGQQLLGRMSSAMPAQPLLTAAGGPSPPPPVIRPLANGPIRTVLRSHALTSMVGSTSNSSSGVLGQSPKRRLPRREF
jgi:hypothetical protein